MPDDLESLKRTLARVRNERDRLFSWIAFHLYRAHGYTWEGTDQERHDALTEAMRAMTGNNPLAVDAEGLLAAHDREAEQKGTTNA